MSHVACQMYKRRLQFNNIATIIFRQNVRYTSYKCTRRRSVRDLFILTTAQDETTIGLSQETTAKVSKQFRRN